ncbi:alpha/beta fold hydrolase [Saccharospirillum alexandrii]|uniref:alpha/beta fold hydrolase n=1 Tax=Saccharospirillum alexandrii TaxID=2448477 RepID=UPI001C7016E4|nr:alpha/beta fold hydrolase [Saccharospirillum alexandrii]
MRATLGNDLHQVPMRIDWRSLRRSLLPLIAAALCCLLTRPAWALPEGYGVLQGGGYFVGRAEPESHIRFAGQSVPVDAEGRFILGFERMMEGEYPLSVNVPGQAEQRFQLDIEGRDYRIQRVDGLDPSRVTPPEEQLARILAEAERVKAARARRVDSEGWLEPFVWPAYGRISGVYGSQRILNGTPSAPHWGIDVAVPTGTPVYAPASGVVTLAEPDLYFSGGTVLLNHGMGLTSSFLHLSGVHVSVGDQVEQGELIAAVGTTGRSTGPHLDWRVSLADVRIDAGLMVPEQEELCTVEGEGDQVVVLVHGLGRTDRSMARLAGALQEAGFATCNQEYPSRKETVPELSAYVANAVERVNRQGYDTVHLVTHSLGGILARYWLQRADLPGQGRVVMLSPPNHGSEVIDALGDQAWFQWIMGPAALELSTDDEALVNQLDPINVPVGVITGTRSSDPWFNVLFQGDHDGKVSVASARLSEADGFRLAEAGHTFIMNDEDVRFWVAFFLTNGFFP